MDNNKNIQLNPHEEEKPTEINPVETRLKQCGEHLTELKNSMDTEYIGVTPSTRIILRASELIIDRHNKEFNSILKELVETFNNDENLKVPNCDEVEPETITIPKNSYIGYKITEIEEEQKLAPTVITEDNIHNEDLFNIPYETNFYISDWNNTRENLLKALKKETGKETVTYSDLKYFIRDILDEIEDNYGFIHDEVNRETEFILRTEEEV